MWDYTDTVHDHFLNPRNAKALPDANAIGEVGSLTCGDALKLYLKIDANERIEDAGFQTFGCASAIASSSILTEMLKGMSVTEAEKLTNKDIAARLGGLPKEKMHCSVMGQEALEAALRHWRGEPLTHVEDDGPLICRCFGVSEGHIRRTVRENGLRTVEEVVNFTKAGGGCGDCISAIEAVIAAESGTKPLQELTLPPRLTNVQRMRLISKVLDEEIRPRLLQDGGDIELVDVDGPLVTVSLRGKCGSCRSSALTLKNVVEKNLREQVSADIQVQEAV